MEAGGRISSTVNFWRTASTSLTGSGFRGPGRKLATIGFSMGGLESFHANLNDPEAVSASVMVYGFDFDKIDTKTLERLQSPVPGNCRRRTHRSHASGREFSLHHERGETAMRNIHLSGCGPRLRATTLQRRKELQSRSRPYQLGPGPGFPCHSFGALTLGRRKGRRTGLLEILETVSEICSTITYVLGIVKTGCIRGHSHYPTKKMNLAATPSELRR
jgi:hypothetical protein